jgi:hypothetical protein
MNKPNTKLTPNTTPATPVATATPTVPAEKERTKNRWTLDGTILTNTFPNGMTTSFDVLPLFPLFLEYSDTQKETICNGIHQKLGDSCARPKAEKLTVANCVVQMDKTYAEILDGTAWKRKGGKGVISMKKQIADGMSEMSQEDQNELKRLLAMAKVNI